MPLIKADWRLPSCPCRDEKALLELPARAVLRKSLRVREVSTRINSTARPGASPPRPRLPRTEPNDEDFKVFDLQSHP